MTTEVNDVVALKSYLEAAMGRAKTHPGNVDGVILALTGAIVWKKDADPIEPIGSEGDKKNVLWVKFNGIRYAFSYNHSARTVELRKESTDGEVLYSFSNETSVRRYYFCVRYDQAISCMDERPASGGFSRPSGSRLFGSAALRAHLIPRASCAVAQQERSRLSTKGTITISYFSTFLACPERAFTSP